MSGEHRPWMFTVTVQGIDLSDEHTVALLSSNGPEVYPAVVNGKPELTYRIAAPTARDALLEVVRHVRSVSPRAVVRRVDLDLVSVSDIAARLNRPRESVRAWVIGSRGPGDFPTPLAVIGDGIRIWDWPTVNTWLRQVGISGYDDERLLTREQIDELNVMLSQGPATLPPPAPHRNAA